MSHPVLAGVLAFCVLPVAGCLSAGTPENDGEPFTGAREVVALPPLPEVDGLAAYTLELELTFLGGQAGFLMVNATVPEDQPFDVALFDEDQGRVRYLTSLVSLTSLAEQVRETTGAPTEELNPHQGAYVNGSKVISLVIGTGGPVEDPRLSRVNVSAKIEDDWNVHSRGFHVLNDTTGADQAGEIGTDEGPDMYEEHRSLHVEGAAFGIAGIVTARAGNASIGVDGPEEWSRTASVQGGAEGVVAKIHLSEGGWSIASQAQRAQGLTFIHVFHLEDAASLPFEVLVRNETDAGDVPRRVFPGGEIA